MKERLRALSLAPSACTHLPGACVLWDAETDTVLCDYFSANPCGQGWCRRTGASAEGCRLGHQFPSPWEGASGWFLQCNGERVRSSFISSVALAFRAGLEGHSENEQKARWLDEEISRFLRENPPDSTAGCPAPESGLLAKCAALGVSAKGRWIGTTSPRIADTVCRLIETAGLAGVFSTGALPSWNGKVRYLQVLP